MATVVLRWFASRTVRQAVDMCRQARKMLNAQRDLLPASAATAILKAIGGVRSAISLGGSRDEIHTRLNELEKVANQNLRPYPNTGWRENVEVLLVTGAIVLAFRTFFFQPMAIPSGSAQPTLWGIHEEDLRNRPEVEVPGGLRKWIQSCWSGIHYYHLVAENDGELFWEDPKPIFPLVPFLKRQVFHVGDRNYTAWFVPKDVAAHSGLRPGQFIRRGEDLLKLKLVSGDHLFVNSLVYNFRRPRRGEIIVFHTHDIDRSLRRYQGKVTEDTHYIKRLVGLGGEHVRIGNDRHAVINGHRLDASTPRFENVYTFDPNLPPRVNNYSGHVNEAIGHPYEPPGNLLAPFFPNEQSEFVIRPNHYLVFGDNTMNSFDGRAWGDFPMEKVMGRASFVFWPITERFGWGYR